MEDDAVIKITGNADKPLELIRRFKNERLPNVAVTVDLLTTGIDVPEICNLVFLRQVNSRILFDQMLGRATRLCDFDGDAKDSFRVFDAVRIFQAIGNMTAMRPVVVNPNISFAQLEQEMVTVQDPAARELVREQFLAKLQVKKRHFDDQAAQDFETKASMSPDAFIQKLRSLSVAEVADWFVQNPRLGEILDRKREATGLPMYVSDHPDALHHIDRGYGKASKPEDYLKEFKDFIASHGNELPALITVLTPPARPHAQAAQRIGAGAGSGRLYRNAPGHRLARTQQPGHCRAHHWLHTPSRHWRCADALRRARRPRLAKPAGHAPSRQALDPTTARLAQVHRRANQSQPTG